MSTSDSTPRMPRPGRPRRSKGPRTGRRSPAAITGIALAAVIGLTLLWSRLWTEKLWYDSVGFGSVFRTELITRVVLFLIGTVLTTALLHSSFRLAYRHRPIYAPSVEQDNLERYRQVVEPFRKIAFWVLPLLVGVFTGIAAQSQWQLPLLWLNRQPFGVTDPQFGNDIGFYVFTLPWLRFLVGYLTMVGILAVLAALFTHYVYGGISLQGRASRTTRAARIHLSLLLAAVVLLRGLSSWLDRYELTTGDTRLITGLNYTSDHAILPIKSILALAAIVCAALFVSTIWTRTWRLPLLGVSLLVVLSLLLGGLYPSLVQGFKVRPSERTLEAPYIQRNIKATRSAYNLSGTQSTQYNPASTASQGQLRQDADTVPGIRIVDPAVVSPTFRQLQGVRNFYQFPDTLDVDRYKIGDKTVDTVIAVRELDLDGVPEGQRNWVNDHTVYTHGFGVVAAYGNKRTSEGQPQLFESQIPPTGALGKYEPRIYFGEQSPPYSIVGGKPGDKREMDYPRSQDGGDAETTYQGKGGVPVGGPFNKLAYAIKYRQYNILLSDRVTDESRLLDHRNPRERVQRVAPWLKLDGNTYPVVTGGRVKWVVDGYTTSDKYPYSQKASLSDATSDSLTRRSQTVENVRGGDVNYMRNSVKATVDAYDGSVQLYAWEPQDPILKAWMSAFGGTVQPMSKISGDLMSHLRYPEDLFKVQRELLGRYHVTDAEAFYQGNDFWQVPNDPTQGNKTPTPGYYLSIAMPGREDPAFSLTTTYIPRGSRENLAGFLAVDSDAGSTPGKKKAGYGTLRLLEMPRSGTVSGPGQLQNTIESSNDKSQGFDQTLSQTLSLNRQQGSNVSLGNLLTLPVGGGLLYVEPIYVQARGGTSYPVQRYIVTAFGNKLSWSDTLDSSLDQLFGGDSGASAGDADSGGTPSSPPSAPPSSPPSGTPSPSPSPSSSPSPSGGSQAARDVQKAYSDSQAALKRGDWEEYGKAQKRLGTAIQKLVQEQPGGGSVSVSPSPSGSPSSSPSSTPSKTPTPSSTR